MHACNQIVANLFGSISNIVTSSMESNAQSTTILRLSSPPLSPSVSSSSLAEEAAIVRAVHENKLMLSSSTIVSSMSRKNSDHCKQINALKSETSNYDDVYGSENGGSGVDENKNERRRIDGAVDCIEQNTTEYNRKRNGIVHNGDEQNGNSTQINKNKDNCGTNSQTPAISEEKNSNFDRNIIDNNNSRSSQCIKNGDNSKNGCNDQHHEFQTEPPPNGPKNEHFKGKRILGCAHYKRRAMFVTPCCNKFYKCRYCHDENESHHFDRKTLTELICSECDTRQRVQAECENCGVRFGKYTCLICNLFDDEDKDQYHCDGCGICRVGGRNNFFHCLVCNMCLPIQLKIEGHRCVENMSRSNCPVCLGDIHTSRIPCHIPDCGHLLHKMCFDQLLASGHYVCPICQTSMIDMTEMWEYLDAQALIMPVPKAHENHFVDILCNDCHKTSTAKFHFVGLKCTYCGGYNTTQDVRSRRSWTMPPPKENPSTSA